MFLVLAVIRQSIAVQAATMHLCVSKHTVFIARRFIIGVGMGNTVPKNAPAHIAREGLLLHALFVVKTCTLNRTEKHLIISAEKNVQISGKEGTRLSTPVECVENVFFGLHIGQSIIMLHIVLCNVEKMTLNTEII